MVIIIVLLSLVTHTACTTTALSKFTHALNDDVLEHSDASSAILCCVGINNGCTLPTNMSCCGCSKTACMFVWKDTERCEKLIYEGTLYDVAVSTLGIVHCTQVCTEWCYATVIGMVVDYYYKEYYRCKKEECKIATQFTGEECCQVKECVGDCNVGADWDSVVSLLGINTGRAFVKAGGCLSTSDVVQYIIHKGNPLVVEIQWLGTNEGHVIMIVGYRGYWLGTAGKNSYIWELLIADPEIDGLRWISDGDVCLAYQGNGLNGIWINTTYVN